MKNIFKHILYVITGILDVSILFVLIFNNLCLFDNLWIFLVFLSHGLFYHALHYNQRKILDVLHYFVFILPTLSIFTHNIFLKISSLTLLIVIQIMWVKYNRCILNEKEYTFGYGNELNYFVILLSSTLSINVGYSYF